MHSTGDAFHARADSSDVAPLANTSEPQSAEQWGDASLLAQFTVETFAGLLGSDAGIYVGSEQVASLELIAATPFAGDAARAEGRSPFSLVFRGPRGVSLPQGTYRMEHDALGGFPLFLVPIQPDADGPRYEAVFA